MVFSFSDFDEIHKVLRDLEVEKNHVVCKNQGLKCDLNQLRAGICQIQDTNDRLIEQLKRADCNGKILKDDNGKLAQCIQQKKEEICSLGKQRNYDDIERLKCVIFELERGLDNEKIEICCLEKKFSELLRCIEVEDCTIRCLKSKRAELEQQVGEMECAAKCYAGENKCPRQELEECQCNLQKMNEELSCLCSKLKQCESTNNKLEQQIQCVQEDLVQSHIALQQTKSCGCKIEQHIKLAQDESHKLMMENNCLHVENCELNKNIEDCNKKLKQWHCKYQQVHCECEEFKRNTKRCITKILTGVKCNTRARSVNY